MKIILKIFGSFLIVLLLAALGLYLSGNQYLLKGIWATYLHGEKSATITDKKYFQQRVIPAGNHQPWPLSREYNQRPLSDSLQNTLELTESIAFLVIKNDSIVQEHYWGGFSDSSQTNSFSMAKSITVMLTQIAIQKNILPGWKVKAYRYLPELEGAHRDELELEHLANMTAGLRWNEHYTNAFSITARAYYGPDIENLMLEAVPVVNPPGDEFQYQSGASQLLGLILTRATGKSLSQLASEWLWQPLGAQHPASWHLDSEGGQELNYCCFNSNARDFARFGKLLINYGQWEGRPVLDSAFVRRATHPAKADHYGQGFWIDRDDHLTRIFYMRGILGQYVIVIPEKDLVIVRLGHHRLSPKSDKHPEDFHIYVREVLRYFGA